jgi:tRNA(fMet)-specific endonuclease VapC
MVLLDSDHMSLLQRGGAVGNRIKERLDNLPAEEVATTIISYEEQMRGWLARLARSTTLERQVSDYRELKTLLRKYCSVPVLDFRHGGRRSIRASKKRANPRRKHGSKNRCHCTGE